MMVLSPAESLYLGEGGTQFLERNMTRLVRETRLRSKFIRNLASNIKGVSSDDRFLEIGCGIGANLMPGDVGVDIDPRVVAMIKPKVVGLVGRACELRFLHDGFSSVVLAVGLLMHLPGNMLPYVLQEIARVSRNGIILGEYVLPEEIDLMWNPDTGAHLPVDVKEARRQGTVSDGQSSLLWARPYDLSPFGFKKVLEKKKCYPFDDDLTFQVWKRQKPLPKPSSAW
jgi:SAM-dependent methyltransferase